MFRMWGKIFHENHMLKDVTAALIELSLNQEIGFPYTKEKLESSSKRKKGASEGYTRLFLTIGSMDKVKKKDIIHFLVSKANIRESDIQGIDMIIPALGIMLSSNVTLKSLTVQKIKTTVKVFQHPSPQI